MLTRFAVPVAFCALMAARPAFAAEPGYLGLQVAPDESGKGVRVMEVFGDSPAEKAGFKKDDVITDMDGAAATDAKAFVDSVVAHKPGDEIKFKVLRDGKEMPITVKLGKRPAEPPPAPGKDEPFVGLAVRPGPDGKGVEIRDVLGESPADKAGLKRGDVITEVDGTAVSDPGTLASSVAAHKPGDEIAFKVVRDGKEQQVKVKAGKRPAE